MFMNKEKDDHIKSLSRVCNSLQEKIDIAEVIIEVYVPEKLIGKNIKETYENIKENHNQEKLKEELKKEIKAEVIEELSVCTKKKGGK